MTTLFDPTSTHYRTRYHFPSPVPLPSSIVVTSLTSSSSSLPPSVAPCPPKALLSTSKPRRLTNRDETRLAAATDIYKTLLHASELAPSIQRPIVLRNVEQHIWELFREHFGQHHSFAQSK